MGGMSAEVRRIFVGVGLTALGNGLSLPYLLVYLHLVRGLSTVMAGVVIAYIALIGLAATPVTGWAVDHFGPARMLTLGLSIDALGVLLFTQIRGVGSAFAVATVMAAGQTLMWPPQSALLGRLAPEGAGQRVFGVQFLLLNLGLGIGGLIASAIADVHRPSTFTLLYTLNFAMYAGYVIVSVSLWRVGGPVPKPHDAADHGYREVLRDRVLWRLVPPVLVLLVCGYGQLEVGFTAYATTVLHVAPRLLGVAWAANTFTIVLAQLFVLRFMRGRSRSLIMQVAAFVWVSCWVFVAAAGQVSGSALRALLLMVALGVFGLGETLWSPTVPALLNDLAPEHLRGRYNSIQSASWTVAATLGPLVSGLMIGGGLANWWVWGMFAGCLAGALALQPLRQHLTPAQDGLREQASGPVGGGRVGG